VFHLNILLTTKKEPLNVCLIFLCPTDPPQKGKENTTKGTIKISVKLPHQMGHVLSDQKEGRKQVAPPTKKRKGCVCTNAIGEGPNRWRSKDLTPKSKPRSIGRERGPKKR
jgi:hypothetical protein